MSLAERINALAERPGVTPEAGRLLQLAAQAASSPIPLSTLIQSITMPIPTPVHPVHRVHKTPNPQLHPENDPPDSDITILLLLADAENPVWPGFHDGTAYRFADATTCTAKIIGWLHLDEAAALLEAHAHS